MMKAVPSTNNNNDAYALSELRKRFIIMPGKFLNPTFRDTVTNIEQTDAGALLHFYKVICGGSKDVTAESLLSKLDRVYGEGFSPNGPKILPGNLLNTWVPHNIKYSGSTITAADVPLFVEYMGRMFPVEEERHYMYWWMAHAIRKPEAKINTTPVLRSKQGVGKTFMVSGILRPIMGSSADTCSLSDITGTFQDSIIGKTVMLIDEAYVSKQRTTDALKMFQTNPTLIINRKGLRQVTIDNKLNLILCSNKADAVVFESSDRRFFIPKFIEYKVSQSESQAFIGKLAFWLEAQNGLQLVRDFLEGIDLTTYHPKAPALMTDAKQGQIGYSLQDKLEEQVAALIANVPVVKVSNLNAALTLGKEVSDVKVAGVLETMGCVSKRLDTGMHHITPFGIQQGFSQTTKAKELKDAYEKHKIDTFHPF